MNTAIRSFVAGALVSFAIGAPSISSATTFIFSQGSGTFGPISQPVLTGSFSHAYTFPAIVTPSLIGGFVSSVTFAPTSIAFNMTTSGLQRFDGSNWSLLTPFTFTTQSLGSVSLTSGLFGNPSIAAGTYRLLVEGSVLNGPASYTVQSSVTPVPEPHEWAMMLAGLGLVGWVARRRKKDDTGAGLVPA
jgi:hypothetical protein